MTADLSFLGQIAQTVGATEPALRLLISIIVGKCIQCQMTKTKRQCPSGLAFFSHFSCSGSCTLYASVAVLNRHRSGTMTFKKP